MEDEKDNSFVPKWVSQRRRWRLEVWSGDEPGSVQLFLESTGQRRQVYADWIPLRIADSLVRDLRDVGKVLAIRRLSSFATLLKPSRARREIFRQNSDYKLMVWDERGGRYGSVTIHPALTKDRWIIRLGKEHVWQFVDDLAAAVSVAQRFTTHRRPTR